MYLWIAHYRDGTSFPQLNPETGELRDSALIDRSKLERFELVNSLEGNRPVLTQRLEPGYRFIYRRRIAQSMGGTRLVVHLVGWQKTIHGTNVQHISFVFEDGRIVNANAFNNSVAWMREIVEVSQDLVEVSSD